VREFFCIFEVIDFWYPLNIFVVASKQSLRVLVVMSTPMTLIFRDIYFFKVKKIEQNSN